MSDNKIELKKGIKAHLIKNDIFKTNLICISITTPLTKKNVTKNALIPFLLKRGSKKFPIHEQISIKLDELYGASLNCGIDKVGDNQVLKFIIESIDNNYTLKNEDILKDVLDLLIEITFNPYMENEKFKDNALETEKNHLKELIEGKINDKTEYAYNRCLEHMFEFNGYGLYRLGYLEDLEKITLDEISKYYFELINSSKIDIYVSGNIDEKNVEKILKENSILDALPEREPKYNSILPSTETGKNVDSPKEIQEKLDINQGKLVIGYNFSDNQENGKSIGDIYNILFGGSANSLLFQNVREKAGLAYTVGSRFIYPKKLIVIKSGIDVQNYEKALEIIKEQVEDMKKGKFSEKDIENAKTYIIASIKNIEVEQDTEIVYYMGQELSGTEISIEERIDSIQSVDKKQIIEFANTLQINTIYFLTKQE